MPTATPISNLGIAEIAQIRSVEELKLCFSEEIDDGSIAVLSRFSNLRLRNVQYTSATSGALDALARMPKLERFGSKNTVDSTTTVERD